MLLHRHLPIAVHMDLAVDRGWVGHAVDRQGVELQLRDRGRFPHGDLYGLRHGNALGHPHGGHRTLVDGLVGGHGGVMGLGDHGVLGWDGVIEELPHDVLFVLDH